MFGSFIVRSTGGAGKQGDGIDVCRNSRIAITL
jgi:hypothetical protein